MLESYFLYHVLAFRELVLPPEELETVPPFGGPFSRYKKSFLRIYVSNVGTNLCFCVVWLFLS